MSEYIIKEAGKNGRVEVLPDRLVRILKRTMRRDDIQTIPMRSITTVHYDRRVLGADVVLLHVGALTYKWKVKNAPSMVMELNDALTRSP